ncbi:hypothetical protein [Vibrio diazotrophicus]|uniref:hypothetical protein n=1 Tax=Vibrio diazotrophicus TaxID=685 RepID=UPI000C9E9AAE|nr:hypothetical protein [Vibrio diazotrophicus]PNH82467.1 hypothetical protein C1N27_03090 [Vibrio diazotrophicus]
MIYHHGHILHLAKKAYERSLEDSSEASVSIMLSAMTLECYINEFTHRVERHQKHDNSNVLSRLGFLLSEYERNKNSLASKIELIHYVLNDEKVDKGSSLHQNITMLIKLRNALVHRKPESTSDFGMDPEKVYSLHPFVKFFVERKLIEKPSEKIPPIWSSYVNSPKVALWAYNTVVSQIEQIGTSLPESGTKQIEGFLTEATPQI